MPTFAFLIKNKKLGKNIMIDLSCRMDWWNIAPVAYNSIRNGSPGLNVRENVKEILEEGNGDASSGVTGIAYCYLPSSGVNSLLDFYHVSKVNRSRSSLQNIQDIRPCFQHQRKSSLARGSRTLFCPAIPRTRLSGTNSSGGSLLHLLDWPY